MDITKILACEYAYTKGYCHTYETKQLIRFTDDLIPDMYDHNYTHITAPVTAEELQSLITGEIEWSKAQGRQFCQMRVTKNQLPWEAFTPTPMTTTYGFYATVTPETLKLTPHDGCHVTRINSEAMVASRIKLEITAYGDTFGADFCRRKGERVGLVYLSPQGTNSYLCTADGNAVGKCDLFVKDGVAKIEDFDVSAEHQRKGYGTAILKKLVEDAMALGVDCIYLVTDEEDTAKEMYLKIGCVKVGEMTELFFKW